MARKTFTKEFKEQAVKLVFEQGLTGKQVCQDLGVGHSSLMRWLREYRENGKNAFPGKGKLLPLDEERRDLEKRLRRAEMERDILKKAIAYFAQTS